MPNKDKDLFVLLKKYAIGWREIDRTEADRSTEERVIDGAVWCIIEGIKRGEIPAELFNIEKY